jgi:hypothetical protein
MPTTKKHQKPGAKLQKSKVKQQQFQQLQAIHGFFEDYHFKEAKAYLDEWLEAGLTHEQHYQKAKERSNLMHFHKSMLKLVEACSIVNSSMKDTV